MAAINLCLMDSRTGCVTRRGRRHGWLTAARRQADGKRQERERRREHRWCGGVDCVTRLGRLPRSAVPMLRSCHLSLARMQRSETSPPSVSAFPPTFVIRPLVGRGGNLPSAPPSVPSLYTHRSAIADKIRSVRRRRRDVRWPNHATSETRIHGDKVISSATGSVRVAEKFWLRHVARPGKIPMLESCG